MDRHQFCELIKAQRDKQGMTWLNLSIITSTQETTLRKILSGNTNFFVDSIIPVTRALKMDLVVRKLLQLTIITSNEALVHWAQISQKQSGLSVNKLKDLVGMSRVSVTANIKGESRMRIDTFLKWAEATGYQVYLVTPETTHAVPHPDVL